MERQSTKHGPIRDESLKHETQGLVKAGRSTRIEEWRDPEPAGEDQPDVDARPDGTLVGGVPPGMTGEDVDLRSTIATYLGRSAFPASSIELVARLQEQHAPDRLVDAIGALSPDNTFENLTDLLEALGLRVENTRF